MNERPKTFVSRDTLSESGDWHDRPSGSGQVIDIGTRGEA